MVFCQECNKRSATVYLTTIVNGDRVEVRLCEQCAKESGEFGGAFGAGLSLQHLLSGLLQGDVTSGSRTGGAVPSRCECGMTQEDFAKTGRLGCHKCYSVFADRLGPMLRRIHGNGKHVGKVPGLGVGQTRTEAGIAGIEDLRESLHRLVAEENYEEAAKVRDRIRELGRGHGDAR